ncbi:hypothetical protein TWF281_011600 [Arthrobotrys megalospora]
MPPSIKNLFLFCLILCISKPYIFSVRARGVPLAKDAEPIESSPHVSIPRARPYSSKSPASGYSSENTRSGLVPFEKNDVKKPDESAVYAALPRLNKRVYRKRKRPIDPDYNIIQRPEKRQRDRIQKQYRASIERALNQIYIDDTLRSYGENHKQEDLSEWITVIRPQNGVSVPREYLGMIRRLEIGQEVIREDQTYLPVFLTPKVSAFFPDSNLGTNSDLVENIALKTFISAQHLFIVWEGYQGSAAHAPESRINNHIPGMLYMAWSHRPVEQEGALKYISITNILDIQTIEIARETLGRLLMYTPGQGHATSTFLSLRLEDVDGFPDSNPRRAAWLALCGTLELITLSRMLAFYHEELRNARFSRIYLWLYDVPYAPNLVQQAAAILVELEIDIEDDSSHFGDETEPSVIFETSVKNGKQNIEAALEAETRHSEMPLGDPPIASLPDGMEMDFSWSGGQGYPFTAWIKSLHNPWRSEEVFLRSGPSYRKARIIERLSYNRVRTVFWATASAEDKHLAFWWTSEAVERQSLVDWMYRCWVTGSNNHLEPGIYPDEFYQEPSMPATNLKYITIWDVQNPLTVSILRETYHRMYPGDSDDILERAIYIDRNDQDAPNFWPALMGTVEIGEINQMCIQYPIGMRGAKISKIEVVFHVVSADTPLRASIIVELTEEYPEFQGGISGGLADVYKEAAEWRLNVLEPKRLQITVSHFTIEHHPLQQILRARASYEPSENPSYVLLRVEEPPGSNTGLIYDFAISSQESHIVIEDIYSSVTGTGLTSLGPLKSNYLEENLGEIIFSTWFAQEGWSKITDITFLNASDSTRAFATVLNGGEREDFDISIPNDGSDDFKDITNAFYESTLEGKSIHHLLKQRTQFLALPEIQLLEIGSYRGRGQFIFLRFGEQLQPDQSEPIDQTIERSIYRGIVMSRKNELLTQYFSRTGQFGHAANGRALNEAYRYDPAADNELMSRYDFDKRRSISAPIKDMPAEVLATLKDSRDRRPDQAEYFSVSVKSKANSLLYEMEVSQTLGNVIILQLPDVADMQFPEQLSVGLTSVIYATWTSLQKEDFTYTQYEAKYTSRIGIRAVTFLEFSPETKRVIRGIRGYLSDEIRENGYIELQNPIDAESAQRIDNQPKSKILTPTLIRLSRAWLALLGTPEVSAIGRIYPKYYHQLERNRHIPRSIQEISIIWLPNIDKQKQNGERVMVMVKLMPWQADKMLKNAVYQLDIINSGLRDTYVAGEIANVCDRYCGLEKPLPDWGTNYLTMFSSKEGEANQLYDFRMGAYQSKILKFPGKKRLEKTIYSYIQRLENCKDYSDISLTNEGEGTQYWLKVSQHCRHLALVSAPYSVGHPDGPSPRSARVQKLAAIYFEAWRSRVPEPISPTFGSQPISIEYVSIEKLSDETVNILNFMAGLWRTENTAPVIDSKYLKLHRSLLFVGALPHIYAWTLLLGSLEIGAVAEMIRLYPSRMRGQRIESILIWPTSTETIRALVGISKPGAEFEVVEISPTDSAPSISMMKI